MRSARGRTRLRPAAGSTEAPHSRAVGGGAAGARPLDATRHVLEFGEVAELEEERNSADETHRCRQVQTGEALVESALLCGVAAAPQPCRHGAYLFLQRQHRLPFLADQHVTEQAAEKSDLGPQRTIRCHLSRARRRAPLRAEFMTDHR
jgi:hypothetical protein